MPKRQNAENETEKVIKRVKVIEPNATAEVDINGESFLLSKDIVDGTILTDLALKKWRVGGPIGKGSFGEIFLASDNVATSVTSENAKYVAKIEPHSNGPLFVEIHCLLKTGKPLNDGDTLPRGMPPYIASGSHFFSGTRYRFLILPRYICDLSTLLNNERLTQKTLLTVAVQILDILQHLHDRGYAHSDIKSENLMVGTYCLTKARQKSLTDNSSQSSVLSGRHHKYDNDLPYRPPVDIDDSGSPAPRIISRRPHIEFGGSNPVRSCRMQRGGSSTIYQDMVNRHYLRPTKAISYRISDDEDELSPGRNYLKNRTTKTESKFQNRPDGHDECIYLIDFGLASKFVNSQGVHHPFCMDQRRAHDGTLEFTSRDAHMGAHSRRSDLECLGYNLIYWSEGSLPWKNVGLQNQPNQVHRMKEVFMPRVKQMLTTIYGKDVPKYLGEYMAYVEQLQYKQRPDYEHCKRIFINAFVKLGYRKEEMKFNLAEARFEGSKLTAKRIPSESKDSHGKDIKTPVKSFLSLLTPFKENDTCGTPNSISPKNLRSKVDKKAKQNNNHRLPENPFEEIINPDEVARKRADIEFEREATEAAPEVSHRYTGRPTYAILMIQNRLRDKLENRDEMSEAKTPSTKLMLDNGQKKKVSHKSDDDDDYVVDEDDENEKSEDEDEEDAEDASDEVGEDVEQDDESEAEEVDQVEDDEEEDDEEVDNENNSQQESTETGRIVPVIANEKYETPMRQKLGLRTVIKHTRKSIGYRDHLLMKRQRKVRRGNTSANDESSGSSSSLSSSSSARRRERHHKTDTENESSGSGSSSSSSDDMFAQLQKRRSRKMRNSQSSTKRDGMAKNRRKHAAHQDKSTTKRTRRRSPDVARTHSGRVLVSTHG